MNTKGVIEAEDITSLVMFRGQRGSRDVPSYSGVAKVLCYLNIGQKAGLIAYAMFSVLYYTVVFVLYYALLSVLYCIFCRIALVGFWYN